MTSAATEVTTVGKPDPRALARRVRRFGAVYYAWHVVLGMRAYAWSMVAYAVGLPLLYMVAMGVGLGTLVDRGVGQVDNVSYLQFVAPAILVSTMVMAADGELSYPVRAGFQWRHLYYGPIATPITPGQLAVGQVLGTQVRLFAQAGIFWVIMVIYGATSGLLSLLLIPISMLAATAFGTPLQAYVASIERERGQLALVQRFIVMPMFLFSGTFFPLDSLPVFLRPIGWISPVWHGSQLARVVSYGAAEPTWLIVLHVIVLLLIATAGLAVGARIYRRKLID